MSTPRAPTRAPRSWRKVTERQRGGSLQEAGRSGGVQLYAFPDGTEASVVVSFKRPLPDEIEAEIKARNWTSSAAYLKGEKTRDRAYSCDGYGVIRNRVGDW